jgi:hypothetical protein
MQIKLESLPCHSLQKPHLFTYRLVAGGLNISSSIVALRGRDLTSKTCMIYPTTKQQLIVWSFCKGWLFDDVVRT